MTLFLVLVLACAFGLFRKAALLVLLALVCLFVWKAVVLGIVLLVIGLAIR